MFYNGGCTATYSGIRFLSCFSVLQVLFARSLTPCARVQCGSRRGTPRQHSFRHTEKNIRNHSPGYLQPPGLDVHPMIGHCEERSDVAIYQIRSPAM
jgi:hypothetical protein